MKVALVSPYDWGIPGGVNQHVASLADRLRARGNYVRVLAPSTDAPETDEFTPIGRPIPLHAAGSVVRISLNPTLGGRVRDVLERERFDIVHVHEPLCPMLPLHVLRHSRAVNPEVVNVGTFHARKDGGNRLYSYTRPLLKRWFRELDGKIAVSPPAAQYISRYFPGYYNIIPNGIDIDHWADPSIAPVPELDDERVNILYVGRAEKRKGLAYLLRAFDIVNERDPATRLIVVGPPSAAQRRYRASVERSGQRNVVFVEGPSYEELPRYHRTADIFCSPATGNESQGYVLLEAMSASLPVVASNIDGYASVITDGIDGSLVHPKDPLVLADAITQLVRDRQARASLATAGRQRAEAYSWPRVTQGTLSYYERLLDQRHAYRRPATTPIRLADMITPEHAQAAVLVRSIDDPRSDPSR